MLLGITPTHKNQLFLHTSNEQYKKEMEKAIPFTILSKSIKHPKSLKTLLKLMNT